MKSHKNLTPLYHLQLSIDQVIYKNADANVSTTNSTKSEQIPPEETLEYINSIQLDIAMLEKRIDQMKNEVIQTEKGKIKDIKEKAPLKRSITQRIHKINKSLSTFNGFIQNRSIITKNGLASKLKNKVNDERKTFTVKEKMKTLHTNKIHNFTDITLPLGVTSILNKGTNFIPTSTNLNPASLKDSTYKEVKDALNNIILKQPTDYNTVHKRKKSTGKKKSHNINNINTNPFSLLDQQQGRPNFNQYLIDYVHQTLNYTKEYLDDTNFSRLSQLNMLNIDQHTSLQLYDIQCNQDIVITQSDKNMGWALLPISWYINEYARHLKDANIYKIIEDFNLDLHTTECNAILGKLKSRFNNLVSDDDKALLNPLSSTNIQLPYMKLLPKVHKLSSIASSSNLSSLTGRPIITAHSWSTSNISKLLGLHLDSIILKFKDLFVSKHIHFPLIYNSLELVEILCQHPIYNINNYKLISFDFSSLYTNISFQDTINAIVNSCKLLKLSTFYRDFLLNINQFLNDRNFFTVGGHIFKQIHGIAMGSYHSRQMATVAHRCHGNGLKSTGHSIYIARQHRH
ncbi:uncharacterized protein LOC114540486 [Dendronephthya gigantea]|uniref:uncharacterized protein LOC114540486 n=1 Tax=Dendronephthya gigantea TaxID=151771 RepID=UPI00106A202D|nr:uncharacterized protein LOC114540486 [Dendronephthya gigantea]